LKFVGDQYGSDGEIMLHPSN